MVRLPLRFTFQQPMAERKSEELSNQKSLIGEAVNRERVPIREASLRLHIPQSAIRQCIQDGELKAYRQTCPDGRRTWAVELPEEGWTSAAMAIETGRPFSPWGWADRKRAGNVHYVEVLSTSAWEEIFPKFLCGLTSDNVWLAEELAQEEFCPQCLLEAKVRNLPLS
jgi:hypothetical protein